LSLPWLGETEPGCPLGFTVTLSWDEEGDRLAARSIADGDPTGWFDRLYAAGVDGLVEMPWDRSEPHPLVAEWAAAGVDGGGRTAVVVGCGLGADAEYLSGLGFATTAFDVAPTAVRVARERHPGSTVDYRVADLLDLPADWSRAFDLVVDVFTVQALPDPPRREAIVDVGRLVAPGGSLLVVAFRGELDGPHPPWPLSRDEIDAFATDGLTVVRVEEIEDSRRAFGSRWRAEFRRD
jgi:SAM-dependent methyltransferase